MIKTENLKFSYNKEEILKGINLNFKKGDFVGIIGPNGSGKSTLLKNISRSLQADSGIIYLDSRILNEYGSKELAQKLAVVPQDCQISFNFDVYDVIMMGRHPYQKRWSRLNEKDRKIVNDVMEVTDTLKLKEKKINELSGGERQRVIIARALAQKPEILLLDEPTASLDINYQGEIYDLLEHLNSSMDLTIITVSHDLNLTAQYCKKLILLKKGYIFASGSAEEVLTEKNIKEVYNTKVMIYNNPISNKPFITLIPSSDRNENKEIKNSNINIHVISGGGTAKFFLADLAKLGYEISIGVLNIGDADWQLARELGLEIVEAPPFEDISQAEIDKNKKLISKSDIIVMTDVPFGHGNLENIIILESFPNKPKIFFNNISINKRDYTKGKAGVIWNKLLNNDNIKLVKKREELFNEIKELEKLKVDN
ncbi:MAG: ABC transporter ATP-binding protein [Halanaerobium sp.]